jgi:acyl-CoA thioesterase
MCNPIIKFFENDRFAAHCGAKLIDVDQGRAVARLDIEPQHFNAAGGVQGGAIFTLCDFAFAAAINSHGSLTVGVSSSIQYFSQPKGAYITAIAREISRGHKLSRCREGDGEAQRGGRHHCAFLGHRVQQGHQASI